MNRRSRKAGGVFRGLLMMLVCLAVMAVFIVGVGNLQSGSEEQGKEQLEDALRKATVACYASEGIYPSDLDYIVDHYGVQIDENRYSVHYDYIAANLMPDITVLYKS